MTIRNSRLAAAAFLAGSVAFLGAPLRATVLFQVQSYFASGPVSLLGGQTASACVSNPDASPIAVLIALLTADTSSLLATRQITLQPGMGVCVNYARPMTQQGDINQQVSPNVYAVVVQGGRLDSSGRIVQDRPGTGGDIVASLQVQLAMPNNTPGQTILYAPLLKHQDSGRQDGN